MMTRARNSLRNRSERHRALTIALIAVALLGGHFTATSQLSVQAQIRPRTEIRRGYRSVAPAGSRPAVFTSQRTRLVLLYRSSRYRLGLALQDVRVWGDEEQLKDVPSAALHEAWAEIDFTPHLSLKFGRQELVYDDHRLLGNVGWTQQARSHDAAVLKYHRDHWKAHLGVAFNNDQEKLLRSPYLLNNYRSLFYVWLHTESKKRSSLSWLAVADGFQVSNPVRDAIVYRYTFGPYATIQANPFDLTASFYYQTGKTPAEERIQAYFFAIQAGLKFTPVSFRTGLDFLSGTKPNASRFNTFNTLYATNHKFYGTMDYFLNIPVDTRKGGLVDLWGQLKWPVNPRSTVSLDYHWFRLARKINSPTNPSHLLNKSLASELDTAFLYRISPEVSVRVGFSTIFPTASLETIRGGDRNTFQYWGWFMIQVSAPLVPGTGT